jgi:hypothetical protein
MELSHAIPSHAQLTELNALLAQTTATFLLQHLFALCAPKVIALLVTSVTLILLQQQWEHVLLSNLALKAQLLAPSLRLANQLMELNHAIPSHAQLTELNALLAQTTATLLLQHLFALFATVHPLAPQETNATLFQVSA